jgi:dolichol-phosphate mannosyltransferase
MALLTDLKLIMYPTQYDFSLSVVIPVYNDEEVLEELHARLRRAIEGLCRQDEIVFVDDGSQDRSREILRELIPRDSSVRVVELVRNFGQLNAIAAGLDHARGDVIVIMDSDLQDRPEDIATLLDRMVSTGVPMVIVRWISREDTILKTAASRLFHYVTNRVTNLKHVPRLGIFRVLRRDVIDALRQFPETTATTISLMYWMGYDYEIVDLERDLRYAGSSGYTIRKMFGLAFDRIFSYSLLPIRLATLLGTLASVSSMGLGVYIVLQRLLRNNVLPGWTSLIVVFLLFSGINLLFLGVIGEYLGRIFLESKRRPKYLVGRVCEPSDPPSHGDSQTRHDPDVAKDEDQRLLWD